MSPALDRDDVPDLDDAVAVESADPGQMLRAVASSAAQARQAVALAADAGLDRLQGDRPRAVVVAGMGGSGIAGDVLAAAAGPGCPVPVVTHRGYGLPGWVGAHDVVLAVSCSGATAETLSATEEAVRRGAGLVTVGAADSPLAALGARVRAPHVAVPAGRQPRANIWALSVPLLLALDHLGVLEEPPAVELTAERLEAVAERCHPARDCLVNPAKELALALHTSLVSAWGASPLGGVAAYRFGCQLAENAKLPAVWGVLPEAAHNQVVAYDGRWAPGERDIFADPELDGAAPAALTQVLLRSAPDEHPAVAKRATDVARLAESRGLRVHELAAEGASRLERLASLVCLLDYTSVYLALLAGVDPTPVDAITSLKAGSAG